MTEAAKGGATASAATTGKPAEPAKIGTTGSTPLPKTTADTKAGSGADGKTGNGADSKTGNGADSKTGNGADSKTGSGADGKAGSDGSGADGKRDTARDTARDSAGDEGDPSRRTRELKDEIARTRTEMGETAAALAAKADVPGRVRQGAAETSTHVAEGVAEAAEQARAAIGSVPRRVGAEPQRYALLGAAVAAAAAGVVLIRKAR
ncbi:hypothetical protein AMIS_37520 [Actinoplanes missouriensis 431]|uniref:DUF3618 domain-containing protein n=1 Tax=Actinoplanes missouriensis (strain ATCC 14538 / DSM 43046 / CBS 188.64 / JCM 3121 / NBRC 102363 / NCIMB 12654 / NRRL B-3342 / UNCC 431) TaxID=512565 RepID=I0H7I5_ACTM4|nr:hypothetical protein AMIS_37520 [Actinoplanes missouriensis 431]